MKNDTVREYLKFLNNNHRCLALMIIGTEKFENTRVSIEKRGDDFFLIFEEKVVIDLLEGNNEYKVDFNHFKLSRPPLTLSTCYAGNHIEIRWLSENENK